LVGGVKPGGVPPPPWPMPLPLLVSALRQLFAKEELRGQLQ
jgi:hypothetical protein